MKMQITFKSGKQIELPVDYFEVRSNLVTGEITNLEWKNSDLPELNYVRLSEIAAIVRVDL